MYTSPSGGLAPPPTGSPPPVLDYLPMGVCISVKRGQTLNVRLINALGPNFPPSDANGPLASEAITFYPGNGFRGAPLTNRWHTPNSTNLHTHGARVSALSPGDDILIHVEPEPTLTTRMTSPTTTRRGPCGTILTDTARRRCRPAAVWQARCLWPTRPTTFHSTCLTCPRRSSL